MMPRDGLRVVKQRISESIRRALGKVDYLSEVEDLEVVLERPKDPRYGDFATNVAMLLAKRVKRPPQDVAREIVKNLELEERLVERVDVAGPGFINFRLGAGWLYESLREVVRSGEDFGSLDLGGGRRVNVEFVSANPTGPLTVGHGRGAAVGDTVANVLEKAGYEVTREYYFNDAGNQMKLLGRSVEVRYRQLLGEDLPFPEDGYQGEYIKDIARMILREYGEGLVDTDVFKEFAEKVIFEGIKGTLRRMGIEFDCFFNEDSLYRTGEVGRVIEQLKEKGMAYEQDGALWFKARKFGIEKDRVIVKSSGEPTYRLPDIAYHKDKLERGFDLVIDVLGADHHATYQDVRVGVKALGYDEGKMKVLIHQFVTLMRDREQVRMSTRRAIFVTLDDLLDEVGSDAVRYFFLMRKANSHLDFDLNLAKEQSEENPVYYVQYAHARICSILRFAQEEGRSIDWDDEVDLALLKSEEELTLVRSLLEFPELVEGVARSLEVHRLTTYLQKLASDFHYFYHRHRVVTDDRELTSARLFLVRAAQIVFKNALGLIGVSAPESM